MTELPKAVSEGEMKVGDHVVKIYVLEDGRRMIDAESMEKILAWLAGEEAKCST